MSNRELLVLSLRAPLSYGGVENPPLAGLPSPEEAQSIFATLRGGAAESAADKLAEGTEELFVYEPEELVDFDLEEGPRAASALPSPRFYGRAVKQSGTAGDLPLHRLAAGSYLFFQARPESEAALLELVEWFAREAWWERHPVTGPYFLRRVFEDGKLATQLLRRLEAS